MDRRARHEAIGGFGYRGKLGGHFVRLGHGAAAPAFEKGGLMGWVVQERVGESR